MNVPREAFDAVPVSGEYTLRGDRHQREKYLTMTWTLFTEA